MFLKYYDTRQIIRENLHFSKRLIRNSIQGLLVSVVFIGLLIGIDYLSREVTRTLCNSYNNFLNSIADFFYNVNDIIGIKFLDYFKDVIVIVAGVIGVILGLFFTTFLNIITAKYSNINSVITRQLLEQKTINRYFKLLAIIVASAIIFQFLLIIGYSPTFLSAFIFTIFVIIAIIAFISFGKSSLIYFNAGALALDLITENVNILYRAHKNKKTLQKLDERKQVLPKIRRNIYKIKTIVEESSKPSMTNTALDSISSELLRFSIDYNSFKHTIPSNNNWHLQIQKNKKWDEASTTDYLINNKSGPFLFPKTVDDINNIEKLIIETQFFIFNNSKEIDEKIQLLQEQYKYLQVIAFQSDIEIFEEFFTELEAFILSQISKSNEINFEKRIQFVSLYITLFVQYLVGFNHNFQRIITNDKLRKLAKNIHNFKDTDSIMHMPYSVRIWIDNYQEKLINEKQNEGRIITPLFYTEYELAYQIQNIFKLHFEKISQFIFNKIPQITEKLKESKLLIEALELNSESLELYQKIEDFSGIIENAVIQINELNLSKEPNFEFNERNELLENNNKFKERIVKEMWNLGTAGYSIESKVLPDIYGNFYQFISADILNKILKAPPQGLEEYLPKFFTYNVLYIESLRQKIDVKRFEFTASKLFPLIVDLFEISSISIIIWKAFNLKIVEKSFFNYWDGVFGGDNEKEKGFWQILYPIYKYFNQGMLGMATPSYVKEHNRKMALANFLKNSSLVKLKSGDGGTIPSFIQYYVTENNDLYFKEIVRRLSVDGIGGLTSDNISEVFIEYFLRTRISLKELNIEETTYGTNLQRNMGRDYS